MPQTVTQSGTTKATYGWFADGTKYSVQDASGNGYCYIGSLIYSSTAGTTVLESTDFSGGRIVMNGSAQTIHYHHKDHLGSVRSVTDTNGTVIEQNAYYPFGGRHTFGQTYAQTTANRYKFNGKELQTIGSLDLLDYGARMYDTKTARWLVQDPLAEKYYPFSAYNYCVNNPVMFVDKDGKDWYSYQEAYIDDEKQLNFVTKYAWTTAKSQTELNAAGITGTYLGEAVVLFNGYYDERLGKDGTLTGTGSKFADVIVYGPGGADDIQNYVGFTMSSDYETYGAIDNGVYDVTFVKANPKSKIPKTHIVNNGEAIDCLYGKNNYYPNKEAYNATQKNAIYVHRTNESGFAGYNKNTLNAVSKGCLLINAKDWPRYQNQINNTPYKLIVNRK